MAPHTRKHWLAFSADIWPTHRCHPIQVWVVCGPCWLVKEMTPVLLARREVQPEENDEEEEGEGREGWVVKEELA